MPQPAAPTATVTWRAGNDRISHAHRTHELRTVCGSQIVQERLAWPPFRRCMVCVAALEDVPEGEARALWGNR
jgi:hypothetical protein